MCIRDRVHAIPVLQLLLDIDIVSGKGVQALADGLGGLQSLGVKLGMEESVQLLGLHAENSGVLRDLALVHQVYGDLQSGGDVYKRQPQKYTIEA